MVRAPTLSVLVSTLKAAIAARRIITRERRKAWLIVAGTGRVVIDGDSFDVEPGDDDAGPRTRYSTPALSG